MLIFTIVEVNEKQFRREGNNLIYTANISLMDALDSKAITVVPFFLFRNNSTENLFTFTSTRSSLLKPEESLLEKVCL